jgi:hypothetical protein
VRRVSGRAVVTADGLGGLEALVDSFVRHGASQCGFCTPGILCRLAGLGPGPSSEEVEASLLAHLCRCTGWRGIVDAALDALGPSREPGSAGEPGRTVRAGGDDPGGDGTPTGLSGTGLSGIGLSRTGLSGTGLSGIGLSGIGLSGRSLLGATLSERARLEGRVPQRTGPAVVAGGGGFAADTAPEGCLVAVPDRRGGWAVGDNLEAARSAAGRIPGRRSGIELTWPVEVPDGEWDITLQTTWVEPAYLEPDSSWCVPGGEAADPAANGGAFGAKSSSVAPEVARALADRYGRPVRVLLAREDVVYLGPKRPPLAAGVLLDGRGTVRVAAAEGIAARIALGAPELSVEEVEVAGPPVSSSIRAAGWAEAAILAAACAAVRDGSSAATVTGPEGGRASAVVDLDPTGWPVAVQLVVACGDPIDEVVLRSYLTGAAHMALGWVCSEAIAVDPGGVPQDLSIRSFGIIRARDMPAVTIEIDRSGPDTPVNGSDAAFAAVAAAVWLAQGLPPRWPTRRGGRT